MIELQQLCKRYGGKKAATAVVALDNLSLHVPAGSLYGLLGPNGAGKTTALRILCTLLAPDGGSVRVGGVDALAEPRAVRRLLGYVAQEVAIDKILTGREHDHTCAKEAAIADAARQQTRRSLGKQGPKQHQPDQGLQHPSHQGGRPALQLYEQTTGEGQGFLTDLCQGGCLGLGAWKGCGHHMLALRSALGSRLPATASSASIRVRPVAWR